MSTTTTLRTFAVSDVAPATRPLDEAPYREALEEFLGAPVEAWSSGVETLVARTRSHPLIGALHAAFASHRPVILSPDIVWLTIAQGFAHHVNAHAEALRPRLAMHEGKIKLIVVRNEFVEGSPTNDWPGVFDELSDAVRGHCGEAHRLVVADFSTTGRVERLASEVVLLDTLQAYFTYELVTVCGIPSITLEGTVEDWRSIARRVGELRAFDLDWWIDPLQEVCEQFVRAAEGAIDRGFWDSIYKWKGPEGSGSAWVTGWVRTLFPYLENPAVKGAPSLRGREPAPRLVRNPWLSRPVDPGATRGFADPRGPGRDEFPALPSMAPLLWRYLGRKIDMELLAGPIGVRQDRETLGLRPEIGWAVRRAVNEPERRRSL